MPEEIVQAKATLRLWYWSERRCLRSLDYRRRTTCGHAVAARVDAARHSYTSATP